MQEKDVRLLMEISPERENLVGMMRGVEIQRTRTVKAGKLLWCKSYPIWNTKEARAADLRLEAARDLKGTSAAQKKLNARRAEERLLQMVNANFDAGDVFVTCTYAREKQPGSLTEANKAMRNFMARLRRVCAKKGSPVPAYIYVTETQEKKWGTEYHHHLLLRAAVTREEAEAIWEKAGFGHANTRIIKRMKEGLMGIGKYMAKQVCSGASAEEFANRHQGRAKPDECEGLLANHRTKPATGFTPGAGRHRWCASKGLKAPEPTEADKKISRRKVERIAQDMETEPSKARESLEKCYPGYEVLEMDVKTSKWVTGAYVYAVMARKEETECTEMCMHHQNRTNGKPRIPFLRR